MADIQLSRLISTLFADDQLTPALKAAQAETKRLDVETRTLIQALDESALASAKWGSSQAAATSALDQAAKAYGKTSAAAVIAEEADRRYSVTLEREAVAAAKAADQALKVAAAEHEVGVQLGVVSSLLTQMAGSSTSAEGKLVVSSMQAAEALAKEAAAMREVTPLMQMMSDITEKLSVAKAAVKAQLEAEASTARLAADAQRLLNQQLKEGASAAIKHAQEMAKVAEANSKEAATAAQVAAQESQLKVIFEQVAQEYRNVAAAASESERIRAGAAAQVLQGNAQQIASGRQLTGVQQLMAGINQQNAMVQGAVAANTRAVSVANGQAAVTQAGLNNAVRLGVTALTGFYSAQMLLITAVRSFKELIKGAVDDMFELATATRKLMVDTGMTAEQSSSLLGAFKQYGINGDQAASALGRLGRGLQGVVDAENDGRNGAVSFKDAMRNLGIETQKTDGSAREHIDVLLDVADAYKKTGNETVINGASVALFGRTVGYQLAPFLKQGREGVLLMMDAQKEYGNVLNNETYPAIVRVMMQQKALESQTAGLKLQLAQQLVPAISGVVTGLSIWETSIKAVTTSQKDLQKSLSDTDKAINDQFGNIFAKIGQALALYTRVINTLGKNSGGTSSIAGPGGALIVTLWESIFGGKELDAVLEDMKKAREKLIADLEAAKHPTGSGGDSALPFNEDEITKVTRQLDDFLSNEVGQVKKSLDEIKDARDKSADDIIEKERSLSITLQGLTRTETRAQIEDYVNYTQLRMKLADDIAEKERSLKLELAKLDDTELKAERDNAEKRLDVWHSYNDAISKLEESHKFAHEDYLASIIKANRSAKDTQDKLDSDWADKQLDYEDQRVKARAESLKKIEDLEKQHNSKIADLQRDLFNLRSTGPETADTLNARRMAAEKLLAAMQDKTKAVTDAKEQAAGELAPKLKSIDDQEAKEKKKYEADKALAARKAADDLAEIERNNKQQDLKFESDKRRAKESADYSISTLAREAGERFADYKKAIQLATDQTNHEIQQAKIKASEQIAEMQRVATKRYEDYIYNWNKDVDQANHEIELNRIAMEDKITKIRIAHDEYMAKQDIEKTRFVEDNKVILAEIEKRRLALNSLPGASGSSTSDARAAALNALNAAEEADSKARFAGASRSLDDASKVFKTAVETDSTARAEFNKHMDLALKASQGVPTTAKENAFLGSIGSMNFYLPYDMSTVPKWFEDFIASMSSKGDADIGGYGRLGQ